MTASGARVVAATPGYSGKPLAAKLGVRPGDRVSLIGAPADFPDALDALPPGVTLVGPRAVAPAMIVLFASSAARLRRDFPVQARRMPDAGMLWVGWPKKSSGVVTDVTESVVREVGLATGLVDVKVCAMTEVWSGLKFVRRLADRSG